MRKLPRLRIAQREPRQDARFVMQRFHGAVPMHRHIGQFGQGLGVDGVGAQGVTTMDQMNVRADARKIDGIARCRVAAAHHGDFLAAEKTAVARRAVRHAAAGELLLAGDAQRTRLRARCDDDGPDAIFVSKRRDDAFGICLKIELGHFLVEGNGAEAGRLRTHGESEVERLHSFCETRVVVELLGIDHLAARAHALERRRSQAGTGRVERSRHARRTLADDRNIEFSGFHDDPFPGGRHARTAYAGMKLPRFKKTRHDGRVCVVGWLSV